MMDQFVIQDEEGGMFYTVSPDMKRVQTINRSEKAPGGHVIMDHGITLEIKTDVVDFMSKIRHYPNLQKNMGLKYHTNIIVSGIAIDNKVVNA
jgi:hypothetical protein